MIVLLQSVMTISFATRNIFRSKWILNGYKNWGIEIHIKCMTLCQLLKWQMVCYRMSANNPLFLFWCDTLNYLNTFQIITCRLRNEFAVYSTLQSILLYSVYNKLEGFVIENMVWSKYICMCVPIASKYIYHIYTYK